MDAEEIRRRANYCFACGSMNPAGLRLQFETGEGFARTVFTPCHEHQGLPGYMHGGLAATLIDEAMGWALWGSGSLAMTGRMDLRFRRPVPLDLDLLVEARVEKARSRAIVMRGDLREHDSNVLLVEAEALFMRLPKDHEEHLVSVYRADLRVTP